MERRTFFKSAIAAAVAFVAPRWARARGLAQALDVPDAELTGLREIARVVLPASLGTARQDDIAGQFAQWIRGYKDGAEMNSGYGFTRLQSLPPNPARHYPEQLRALEAAAAAKGSSFAKLDAGAQRSLIEDGLRAAGISEVPPRPNGKYVASDLMSFWFHSSEGQDFLYDAQIRREDCRGMKSQVQRPARWEA